MWVCASYTVGFYVYLFTLYACFCTLMTLLIFSRCIHSLDNLQLLGFIPPMHRKVPNLCIQLQHRLLIPNLKNQLLFLASLHEMSNCHFKLKYPKQNFWLSIRHSYQTILLIPSLPCLSKWHSLTQLITKTHIQTYLIPLHLYPIQCQILTTLLLKNIQCLTTFHHFYH